MAEENMDIKSTEVGSTDFLLFLILILLLLGNRNTFGKYFELFNQGTTRLNQILKALSATAEGLRGAFTAPQKVMKEINL